MKNLVAKLRRLNQTGDTIVEVMVVLAVLGLAIGISYATANNSLLGTRGAEDNAQATEYLQSQIEALRLLAPTSNANDATTNIYQSPGSPFCLVPSGSSFTWTSTAAPGPGACTADSSGANGFNGSQFSIAIVYQGDTENTFILTATWADLQGQGTDTATLNYRVHNEPAD